MPTLEKQEWLLRDTSPMKVSGALGVVGGVINDLSQGDSLVFADLWDAQENDLWRIYSDPAGEFYDIPADGRRINITGLIVEKVISAIPAAVMAAPARLDALQGDVTAAFADATAALEATARVTAELTAQSDALSVVKTTADDAVESLAGLSVDNLNDAGLLATKADLAAAVAAIPVTDPDATALLQARVGALEAADDGAARLAAIEADVLQLRSESGDSAAQVDTAALEGRIAQMERQIAALALALSAES